jgi:hypothetical protein
MEAAVGRLRSQATSGEMETVAEDEDADYEPDTNETGSRKRRRTEK